MEDIDHHAMVMMLELRRQAHRSPPMAACRLRLFRWRLARRHSGSPPVEGGGGRRLGPWGVPEEARLVIQTPMRRLMEGGGVAMGSPAAAAAIRNAVLGGYSANSRYVFYKSTSILDRIL
ncbi:hypothetical protein GQ55_7G178500 [Panicum hallii var. hallii]|uniref:Uncharacterized protein n=1 Tax=Panicum hallii var. hallii TaxID=1504633 RepID=A0A2T7CW73_9POAL|nr:hypothetical protein GQ55_7G178500 [Panicum hallii var. hallii]